MKKNRLILIIFLFITSYSFAQKNVNSVLESDHYFNNPRHYLSQLDTSKMQTNFLIDRVLPDVDLLGFDGQDTATTCGLETWNTIYESIRAASIDTSVFLYPSIIENLAYGNSRMKDVNLIALIDITFDKISQDALDGGVFFEVDTLLTEYNTNEDSYTQHRLASSCLVGSSIVFGDDLKFVVPRSLYFQNNSNEEIVAMEIKLGDSTGYQPFEFHDTIIGNFSSSSNWEEVIVKVRKRDLLTLEEFYLYSHFTFKRAAKSTAPKSYSFNYPLGSVEFQEIEDEDCMAECAEDGFLPDECERRCTRWEQGDAMLNIDILFAHNNNSAENDVDKKLRRPFVIVDGFDYGNKRNYDITSLVWSGDTPLSNDYRGLFFLLDGAASPWYASGGPDESTEYGDVNLVHRLDVLGFDVVFINFVRGADYISNNAELLRSFFNEVLNGEMLRDNLTEEIVLVGPSMGGVVTRQALTKMEMANEEHYVKSWTSFDSPQRGAYIPLALQHMVDYFRYQQSSAMEAVNTLKSPAAKEMLIMHYDEYESSYIDYINVISKSFYNNMEAMTSNGGYPKYSKNYAITNGGISKLYEGIEEKVIYYEKKKSYGLGKADGWPTVNANGNSNWIPLMYATKWTSSVTDKTYRWIGFDNAPGGWYPAIYDINCDEKNKHQKNPYFPNSTRFLKTCFMVTSSAFGIEVTKDNVDSTHNIYTASDTPFDVIYGMDENEQHITISKTTASFMEQELIDDLSNTNRPRNRDNEDLNETVSGKLAYSVYDEITFAGNDNSFTVKSTADVNISSGNIIQLLPGFKIEPGANVSAKITSNNKNSTVLKKVDREKPLYEPSPFIGKKTSYRKNNKRAYDNSENVIIYPNPSDGIFTIKINNNIGQQSFINVYNNMGVLIQRIDIGKENLYSIDLSPFTNGIYQIEINQAGFSTFKRIIKI